MSLLLSLLACAEPAVEGSIRSGAHAPGAEAGAAPYAGGDDALARVRILSPTDGATAANPVTFTVEAQGVARVQILAEGWPLSDPWDPGSSDSLTYTFNWEGPRYISLVGTDERGCLKASHDIELTVGGGDGEAVDPQVSILSPGDGETVENPVTFEVGAEGVALVRLWADGWPLGDAWDPAASGSLVYTFTGTDTPRVVTREGLDEDGAVGAADAITLTATDPDVGDPRLDVPYFYQYDNRYAPSSTCGVTGGAMLIDYWWGAGFVTPDELYLGYGLSQGQSPEGLEQIYRWEGLYAQSGRRGTRADLRAHLDAGRPVVVHGFWTAAGHISVITGYDADGWWVNDPAGDWYQCYGCGISGEQVFYPYSGAWDEDMSWDGDIWWSVGDARPF